ncbi:hypothetical protein BO71DRAFT_137816 [Aspergillus ellipticus CBS 707.79]|uniref:Uncharacterized protein n=1 Tax=Aspergillus ellipticus CBS 707.79 TaxID=1448320 RepID=A0A319DQB1_9EURO|nr:hypothetical protein BO71DRAFT_137816 [Aspergillus ellipticus CBS 707.79]
MFKVPTTLKREKEHLSLSSTAAGQNENHQAGRSPRCLPGTSSPVPCPLGSTGGSKGPDPANSTNPRIGHKPSPDRSTPSALASVPNI